MFRLNLDSTDRWTIEQAIERWKRGDTNDFRCNAQICTDIKFNTKAQADVIILGHFIIS